MLRKSKLLIILSALVFSTASLAQVIPSAESGRLSLAIGGGLDYWKADWEHVARFGPSAWASQEIWRGLGINAEGHSMFAGGNSSASQVKYYVGEGGAIYNYHRWQNVRPFAKAEAGFASFTWAQSSPGGYTHDTRTTWAVGGGLEYHVAAHLWTRLDYTYEGFPDFLNHTLNPAGLTLGATYHFSR